MKCILVTTNNTYKVLDSDNLKDLVGGNIELVRPTNGYTDKLLLRDNVFVCDEDFLMKDKPMNYFGTILYNGVYKKGPPYLIKGDIALVGEELISLTDKEVEYYIEILKLFRFKESE